MTGARPVVASAAAGLGTSGIQNARHPLRAASAPRPLVPPPPPHPSPPPAAAPLLHPPHHHHPMTVTHAAAAVAAAAADGSDQPSTSAAADPPPAAKKSSSLAKRAVAGTILGVGGAIVILFGGWLYVAAAGLIAYRCSEEYTGLVNAKGMAGGMKPPKPIVSSITSLLCVALNGWAYVSGGKTASAMAVSSFVVLSLQLLATHKPRFSQLASAVFGLMYCGYLPSFWVKLRFLAIPAIHSTTMQSWQTALGGVTQATVGVVATFVTVACIIAADTGAYFCGKSLGRTKLISISPKKTVEGAVGGLVASVGVALALGRVFAWPASPVAAAGLGTVIFFASLFGDLIESVIKRDAGLKDAGDLIPGHGGVLDRMDSYLFTGACVYFFIRYVLRGYGI